MKTYRTRISIALLLILAAILFLVAVLSYTEQKYTGIVVSVVSFILIIGLFCCIKYVIDGKTLRVYYFPGVHTDIDITTITKMERSWNPLSSPAASIKRLAVHFGKGDVVYISPRHEQEFIDEINRIKVTMLNND